MEAAIIIGGIIGMLATLFALTLFDQFSFEKYNYRFIFNKPKIITLLIATSLITIAAYGNDNGWQIDNIYVCAGIGGLIFLTHGYLNIKHTGFLLGSIGTIVQITVALVLAYVGFMLISVFFLGAIGISALKGQTEALKCSR